MSTKNLEASVRYQPRVAIVDLHGEIDAFAEDVLNTAYAEAESRGTDVIMLNFTDVNYINSTGIALIVSLLAKARAEKRQMLACGLSPHYVEIFEITRLADFMTVYPDESTALSGAAEGADRARLSQSGCFRRPRAGYTLQAMPSRRLVPPFVRQLAGDPLGLGRAAQSAESEQLGPRTATADKVVKSVCPFCAVGCGQNVYVKNEKVVQVEGDPDSPVSRGRLCPRGSSTMQLVTKSPSRLRPSST